MPEPQKRPANLNNICNKTKKPTVSVFESKTMRKVRVICSDPYATDSSSSEDESEWSDRRPKKLKRFVREINLPLVVKNQAPKPLETESSSSQVLGGGPATPKRPNTPPPLFLLFSFFFFLFFFFFKKINDKRAKTTSF
jgi:hypothetical protein